MTNKTQLEKVVKAARRIADDDRVPYAFEKRVMARLRTARVDLWEVWGQTIWRAALSCLAITIMTGAVVRFTESKPEELFAGDLERTVLAPVDVDDTW